MGVCKKCVSNCNKCWSYNKNFLAQGIKRERQLRIKKYFELGKNIVSFDLINFLSWKCIQSYELS